MTLAVYCMRDRPCTPGLMKVYHHTQEERTAGARCGAGGWWWFPRRDLGGMTSCAEGGGLAGSHRPNDRSGGGCG